MYVVSGSAGMVGGTSTGYPHNCMYYSNPTNGGCLYFEVDSNRLDVKFVSYTTSPTPVIRDQFTIFKDVNKSQNINAVINDPLTLTASWKGTYYWPNNGGATTRSVVVNNNTEGTFAYPVTDASSGSCIQDVFNITVSGTVPVMLRYFNATIKNDKVILEWSTSQENNNKYFTVEKSNDGMNFYFLGKVNGAGTSSVNHTYQLMDYTPWDGVNYYRLSQTNIDGNTNNYEIKTVNYISNKNFSTVILNNGNGQISVAVKHTNATMISMKVVDLVGKEILQESFSVNNGGAVRDIYLNRGVYILVLMNNKQERISNKIIVR
jgi:hypothetical protein